MSRREARELLGLPADGFVVLMTGGAWGLGDIAQGVGALLKMEPPVHVVTVCGKNARARSGASVPPPPARGAAWLCTVTSPPCPN